MTEPTVDPIVIDNGSGYIKAGFGGDDAPRCAIPSVIGHPKASSSSAQTEYVDDDALQRHGMLKITYPIERGIVKNWQDMETVWRYTFDNMLKVSSTARPVLLTDRPLNPKIDREKMTTIFFETFEVPSMYVENQGVLALFDTGRTTGVVLDSGEGLTTVAPISEARVLNRGVIRSDVAGHELTDYLNMLLTERGHYFKKQSELEMVREMKEKMCYVALDFQAELEKAKATLGIEKSYTLPGGHSITLTNERFRCPELLFQPSLFDLEEEGLHENLFHSIMKCPPDLRGSLCDNIVLAGGSAMFPGLLERLQKELADLAPESMKVKLNPAPQPKNSVWVGGSILSTIDAFKKAWLTKEEYDESGPSVIHQKSYDV